MKNWYIRWLLILPQHLFLGVPFYKVFLLNSYQPSKLSKKWTLLRVAHVPYCIFILSMSFYNFNDGKLKRAAVIHQLQQPEAHTTLYHVVQLEIFLHPQSWHIIETCFPFLCHVIMNEKCFIERKLCGGCWWRFF